MPLLSDQERLAVSTRLSGITHPVTLLLFTETIGAPETTQMARQIVDEVTSLAGRVTVEEVNLVLERDRAVRYGIGHAPAIVLLREGTDTGIRFLGAPGGYEIASLLEAVVLASTGDSGLSAESRTLIRDRAVTPIDIKVFVTPSCAHCPRVVTLAHRMAIESPNVRATCVEATAFIDLSQRYRVTGVPKTIVEGTDVAILGVVSERDFVSAVLGN